MNGLYLQLHAYMLRIAIPYGTLSSAQLRKLAHVARTYDRGYGHFTTRTNLQLHWIKLRDAPDILDDLASVGLHAIQTSGNCIRNLTADPLAGATADEVDDPRIWAEAIRQWSTFHPEFSFLPRKFKIAVTAAPTDRAATRIYDIGLRLHRGEGGALAFEVLVGGGLGRTPYLGPAIRPSLPAGTAAVVPAGDPARLQSPRPARQPLESAHQGAGRLARGARRSPARSRPSGRRATGRASTCRTPNWRASAGRLRPAGVRSRCPPVRRLRGGQGRRRAFARFARRNVTPHKTAGLRPRRRSR